MSKYVYTYVMSKLGELKSENSGATAIEYGLIATLVAVAIVTAVSLIGDELGYAFTDVTDQLPDS